MAIWYGDKFPFKERMKAWLMRDLPNFSYDSMDEIIRSARAPENPCRFPDEPRRTKKPIYKSAPPAGFDLVHIFEKSVTWYDIAMPGPRPGVTYPKNAPVNSRCK
jgi:hypothetical protein